VDVRRDLIRLAATASLGLIVAGGYTTYRIWAQGQRDEERPADAIVVMGAAQYNGMPSPVFRARLDHAVSLYLGGVAPRLVVTGGKAEGDRTTEAAAGRAFAMALGVPEEDILIEDQSRTTHESIRNVVRLLDAAGARNAIFVSDRPHMLRVLRMAADEGIVAWGSPTRTSPIEGDLGGQLDATVHELGALAYYFITGGSTPAVEQVPQ
jgi:uncharacterized SAM-binding protein YcdF (DUF218 family)